MCSVVQLCLALCNPMDCSLPGSSVHGTFQARIMEWVAISFSREYSRPKDQTQVTCIAGRFFTVWATREAQLFFLCLPMYIFAVNTSHFVSLLILHPTFLPCPTHLLTPSNNITLGVKFEHKDLGETRLVHKREENGCYVSLLRILLIHCSSSSLGVVQMWCAAWS